MLHEQFKPQRKGQNLKTKKVIFKMDVKLLSAGNFGGLRIS